MTQKLKFDQTSVIAHLSALGYVEGDRVYLRTIATDGRAKKLETIYPNLPELPTDTNVYVVVNGCGHSDKNVTECRAIFCEHDNLDKTVQLDLWQTLGLPEPTVQIDTGGKSIHTYWVFEQPIPVADWKPLQSDLLEFADADRTIKNPSRVMRLAGSIHQGTDQQATIVNQSGQLYSYEQLRGVIPERFKPQRDRSQQTATMGVMPLTVVLAPKKRALIESGSFEGSRNELGAALARDLIGCENSLSASGIQFDGTAERLFQDYCERCTPPIDERERDTIWRSAMGDNPTPTLSVEKLTGCVQAWQRKNRAAVEPRRGITTKLTTQADETESKPPKQTAADSLLTLSKQAIYFHTSDKVAYADIWIEGNRHTYAVRSKAFRLWLTGEFFNKHGKGIGAQTLQDTLGTLEAIAIFQGETHEVHLRTAEHQGKIYLDLGTPDWKAVEIDASGWRLTPDPPVRFWRPDSLLPLPYPVEGGSLDELRELLNVDGAAWTLIITFLLFCYHPKHHKPILILHGEQGSGKTTVAEFLKSLIDPGKAGLLPAISDAHRMAIAASRRWVLAYDNLSGISPEQSDALCRISTGGGFSTRTLHTTDEETVFEFTRPQIITGIDSLATRGDLLQRSLMVSLPSITPDRRKTREALETQLNEARPRILGALLTALSQTLKALPETNPANLPRMADFGRFAIAAETALNLKPNDFVQAFDSNRDEAHEIVLESSPVAQAILRMMDTRTVWQGTASELLADLEPLTPEKTTRSRQWPGNSRSIGKALTRLAPDLRGLGIDVDFIRSGKVGTRKIVLEKLAQKTSETSAMSEPICSNGFRADMKADMKSEADVSCQPNVSQNVSPETSSQQEIQLSADVSDMADMKNTPNSKQPEAEDLPREF